MQLFDSASRGPLGSVQWDRWWLWGWGWGFKLYTHPSTGEVIPHERHRRASRLSRDGQLCIPPGSGGAECMASLLVPWQSFGFEREIPKHIQPAPCCSPSTGGHGQRSHKVIAPVELGKNAQSQKGDIVCSCALFQDISYLRVQRECLVQRLFP
ncbi:hypothetical protein BJX99DRAFT_237104 [Aspergillus californicus]